VSIVECAHAFAVPLNHHLTTQDGVLGGAFDLYRLYEASDGWVALAALEPHFIDRLHALVGTTDLRADTLQSIFRAKSAAEWEKQAQALDIPLAMLRTA
jgi:crotonobetainyl-CoA:carnitine CoA-transferase CaiB-like acyl-CoA transferase